MTDIDLAEGKALFVLFMQNRIDDASYETAASLNTQYNARIPDHLLEAAFQKWVREGLAKANSSSGRSKFRLKRDSFADAYRHVLKQYGASEITVHPETREIFSDISPTDDFPMREGWKWFTFEGGAKAGQGPTFGHNQNLIPPPPKRWLHFGPINWTKWGAIGALLAIPTMILLWWLT